MSNNISTQNGNIRVITEKSVLIHLDFRQWTGACSFEPNDLGEMPPKELVAAMGQKRLVDPKVLGVFARIKDRAVALLDNNGTPFLKGWLVPSDRASQVIAGLESLKAEYEAEKAAFLQNLPRAYEEWAQEHPEFTRFIETARKAVGDVESRIHARYIVFAFNPTQLDVSDSLKEEVLGIKDEIIKDVVQRCTKLADQSLTGRESASFRVRNVLATLYSKISGLSYVDNTLGNIEQTLAQLILMVPDKGAVQGRVLSALTTGVAMLSSSSRIREICAGTVSLADTLKTMGLSDLLVDGTPVVAAPGVPKARKASAFARQSSAAAPAVPMAPAAEAAPAASSEAIPAIAPEPPAAAAPAPAVAAEPDLFADLDDLFAPAAAPETTSAPQQVVKPVLQTARKEAPKPAPAVQENTPVEDAEDDFVPPPPPMEMFGAILA